MDKPDWATRLQRTFARKYDAGFAKGLMLGKAVATRDEQERIIGVLKEHIELQVADDTDMTSMDYHEDTCGLCKNFGGLGVAIALIKGEK